MIFHVTKKCHFHLAEQLPKGRVGAAIYSQKVIKCQSPVFLQAFTTDVNKGKLMFANAL